MSGEIKPCPWCGTTDNIECVGRKSNYLIYCRNCESGVNLLGLFNTEEDAIKTWNTRNPDPRLKKCVEVLKSISKGIPMSGNMFEINEQLLFRYQEILSIAREALLQIKGEEL